MHDVCTRFEGLEALPSRRRLEQVLSEGPPASDSHFSVKAELNLSLAALSYLSQSEFPGIIFLEGLPFRTTMPGISDHLADDTRMHLAAFEHIRSLTDVHGQMTTALLKPGFEFEGARIPLINPQRGIFKPRKMRFLLSIKTFVPRLGGKVWYDDQATSIGRYTKARRP